MMQTNSATELHRELEQTYDTGQQKRREQKKWFKKSQKLLFDEQESDSEAKKYCKKCCQYYDLSKFAAHRPNCIKLNYNLFQTVAQQEDKNQMIRQSIAQKEQTQQNNKFIISSSFQQVTDVDENRSKQKINSLLIQTHTLKCNLLDSKCQYCHQEFTNISMNDHFKVCKAKLQADLFEEAEQREIRNRQYTKRKLDQLNSYPLQFQSKKNINRKKRLPSALMETILRQLTEITHESNNKNDSLFGLSKHEISKLQYFNYQKEKQDEQIDQCNICLIAFDFGQKTIKLRCKHLFHAQCIQKWFQFHGLCPVCRIPVTNIK